MSIKLYISAIKKYFKWLVIFIAINVGLYIFILLFHNKVEFHLKNYLYNAHHFKADARIKGDDFNLINAQGQYDAQWYLKIASNGYPKVLKKEINGINRKTMKSLSFAFFPLYPAVLRIANSTINDIQITAFIFSNIMLVINFASLMYVIKKLISEDIAIKTAFLLFLFPFSIFYRSYFTESLFLFILIWYSYLLIKNRMLSSSFLLGLLNITRGSGVLLYIPHFFFLWKEYRKKNLSLTKMASSTILSLLPLGLWSFYNYFKTGDLLFFMKVRSEWIENPNMFSNFLDNMRRIASPGYQDFHYFYSSQVDIAVIFAVLILLFASFKILNIKLWLIVLCLFLSPLLFNGTISFSRMQIVSFPLFIYLSTAIKGKYYFLVASLFAVELFIISLYFVNWYWIG
ncbi:MAG: hypothetical protein HYT09_03755 [Candidatus Levybacteria bacterium]|nr:hypothetical protein [Candidatus Levybacteria bacterium]